jgi:hypothetical protein
MTTSEQEQKKIGDLLKWALVPVRHELNRDLWPQMLRRLDERSSQRPWIAVMFSGAALSSVPWFDWALLAMLVVGVCMFPSSIPIWLYNL